MLETWFSINFHPEYQYLGHDSQDRLVCAEKFVILLKPDLMKSKFLEHRNLEIS